jgi:hypothetical protein
MSDGKPRLRVLQGGFRHVADERLRPHDWQPFDLPYPMQAVMDSNVRLYMEWGLMPPTGEEARPDAEAPPAPPTPPFAEAVDQVMRAREAQALARVVLFRRVLARAWGASSTSHEQRRLIVRLSQNLEAAGECTLGNEPRNPP